MIDDLSAVRAEQRPLHEWASFDPIADVVTIYDMRYSRQLLRSFAVSPTGVTFKIVARRDGVITISSERSLLEAAAPVMLAALTNVRKIISEASMTGFNWKDGDWADRLFTSQQVTSAAIAKATKP